MAVKMRLKRMGYKRHPFYRVIVADARSPRDGRFIDEIGTYDPNQEPSVVKIDAEAAIDEEKAKEMEAKIKKASFDFNDFLDSMAQMEKMGGIQDMLSMLPGMGNQLKNVEIDDKQINRPKSIILSMTPEERSNPDIINPSRKRRIANGAGVDISEVNRLLKQFEQMRKMMKQMGGMMGGKKRGRFRMPFGF